MPPKTIRTDANGNAIKEPTRKAAKPKIHNESLFSVKLRMDREKYFLQTETDPDRRNEIEAYILALEMQLHGFNSATTAKVVTVEENKRGHAEISLQAKFCNWVRKTYPKIKFLRHEREKARSKFMQSQMKVMNSAGSMPDWECTETTDKYAGLYIEFKRPGEKWLMADDKTIKASYADQHYCHNNLWKQRKVCYFCNDLEVAKKIIERYLSGKDMPQRVFNYPPQFEYLENS